MYSSEITTLLNEGSQAYSLKEYDQAASKYADACSLFNEETEADCPDLLLLYGRALFQSGVSKSGVLGGLTANQEAPQKDGAEYDDEEAVFEEGMANEELEIAAEEEEEEGHAKPEINAEHENENDDGAAEDDSHENDPAPEEEQTDFEAAWDILDLSRALFEEKVSGLESESAALKSPYLNSDDETPLLEYVVNLKKLSETYDLLGEVSLESENFAQAAADLTSCLKLRQKMYSNDLSSLVSESHYKLSLALEFCVEDAELRSKAAEHVKQAAYIVRARNASEENDCIKEENEQLLRELDERYDELIRDPEQEFQDQQMNIIKGILGKATSEPSGQARLLSAVQSKVNDLSSKVKKRKAQPGEAAKKQKKN